MSDRLTKADWIRHGLLTLAKDGPAGLKVGPMSDRLKVSRGSFYWHFQDIADFRAQLLAAWRETGTDQVIQSLDGTAEPERLKQLMRRAFGARLPLERATRAWAAEDKDVAEAVAAVDASRVAYIAGLLVAGGVASAAAERRATFLYWAYLGQAIVMNRRHASMTGEDMDEIGGLFET